MKNIKKHIIPVALAIIIIFALFNPFFGLGHTHSCCELECHICQLAIKLEQKIVLFMLAIFVLFVVVALYTREAKKPYFIAKNQSLISWKVEMLN